MFVAIEILSKLKLDVNGNGAINGIENSHRKTEVVKVAKSIELFKELISLHGITQLIAHIKRNKFSSFEEFKKSIPTKITRSEWKNIGGQLIPAANVEKLKKKIKTDKIQNWSGVHDFYREEGIEYNRNKLVHAYTSLLEIENITTRQFTPEFFVTLLQRSIETRTWMNKGIYESREKDYHNPFRKMVYETKEEMEAVVGKIEDNHFIQDQLKELDLFKKNVKTLIKKFGK
ncbi:MAG: hypothetical protein ABIR03_00595 [Ginsengibacter sp.]